MLNEVLQYGYQSNASWITRPLKSDETIASALCGHSERLAIAWNFVESPATTRIQVTKNLRVCGDCRELNGFFVSHHRFFSYIFHLDAFTKLIALIRQCDIIVRDANRIHHFGKDGRCSCNDYF